MLGMFPKTLYHTHHKITIERSEKMLDEKEIRIINQTLKKGYDVEIQHRKNGFVIIKSDKEICYRQEKKESKSEKTT